MTFSGKSSTPSLSHTHSEHGTALRHLPSREHRLDVGYAAGRQHGRRLHQLTTATRGETILAVHGVRGGKAMIATSGTGSSASPAA